MSSDGNRVKPPLDDAMVRGLTLEQKLPLLLAAVLLVVLVAATEAAYVEVRHAALTAARARLSGVGRQLADVVGASMRQHRATARRVAADSAIRALASGRTVSASRVAAALHGFTAGTDSQPVARVWDPGAHTLAASGPLAAEDSTRAAELIRHLAPAESAIIGPLYTKADSVFFWTAARVASGGAGGFVVQRQQITGGRRTDAQIRGLIGPDVTVYLENASGDVRATVGGIPAPPRRRPPPRPASADSLVVDPATGAFVAQPVITETPWVFHLELPGAAVMARPYAFLRRMGAIAAVLMLAGALLAFFLARRMTRPLGALTSATSGVAAGDYTRRVEVRSSDELGRLAASFNTMAERVSGALAMERAANTQLEEQASELEEQASELEQQTAEAQALTAELEESNQLLRVAAAQADAARSEADASRRELAAALEREREARASAEAANHAKSAFLATMSHEVRTPINAIVGYTDLLELGLPGPTTPQQLVHLRRIRASSRHLLNLVSEVLDLATIEAGRLSVRAEVSSLAAAVDTALSVVAPQAGARGIVLTPLACDDAIPFVGDEDRARQILLNLLSNAIKFTGSGGTVEVSCGIAERPGDDARLDSASGPWAYVRVRDTGIGIPSEELTRIFDAFVQADTGHTRQREGAGLGLTISRRLARLMGGELSAQSTPGVGSVFTLWLPAAPGSAPLPETRPASGNGQLAPQGEAFADLAGRLQRETSEVVHAFVRRLVSDPIFSCARSLKVSQLADHTSTLLADLATALLVLQDFPGQPTPMIGDTVAIQRIVAERHGAQRARLGWSEAEVRHEFDLLREEVERTLRRSASDVPSDAVRDALVVIGRLLDQAAEISVGAFSVARAV